MHAHLMSGHVGMRHCAAHPLTMTQRPDSSFGIFPFVAPRLPRKKARVISSVARSLARFAHRRRHRRRVSELVCGRFILRPQYCGSEWHLCLPSSLCLHGDQLPELLEQSQREVFTDLTCHPVLQ